jgi:serine/threonine protein kinase/tetratricopeptide (TPR) repeat protein
LQPAGNGWVKLSMDVSQWQRMKDLFNSALEREPGQRDAFLAEACGGNESLRQEIQSLLAQHRESGTKAVDDESTAEVLPADQSSFTGRRIGSYRVVKRIGQGGMATVYLAVRADDQYKKRVAIKLIPAGLDNQELSRRFRNERQTLAALDHPNIVKLLDGGTTEDNLPYFVMDYVEGVPLDEYCDNRTLSTDERLRLFLKVCDAVQYAHQRLIIHRDLKPGNVLVTADGAVKLLDFGIAKLLNPEIAVTLVVTRTGQRAMTPEYVSPEQVRGEPLTSATDVYSLGVILYELLTGHRPYQSAFSIADMAKAICEDEPLKPSTVVTRERQKFSLGGTRETITAAEISHKRRETDAKRLRSRLHGDLDAVVMTALRKEPQRRYPSVFEFAQDIQKHLDGLPVKARHNTAAYRISKFARRHKESAVVALIVISLVGGVTSWNAYRQRAVRLATQRQTNLTFNPRRSIAVLGFRNLSGRPGADWLSTAVEGMLTTELELGEKFRTIPGELIAQAKINLELHPADALSPATLTAIRNNLGTDLVVLGSYVTLAGGQIRIDLRVQDTARGETLTEAAETGTVSDLFILVSRLGGDVRQRLGVEPVSEAEAATVRASLPSNPEAARLYAQGLARLRFFDVLPAKELLQQAIKAAPDFALAHSALADAWSMLGYDGKKIEEAKKAFDLATTLPRQDQLSIEGRYREAASQWPRAIDIYRTLVTFAPDNIEYGLRLVSVQRLAGDAQGALRTIAVLRAMPPPARDDPRIDLAEAEAAEASGDFKHELSAAMAGLGRARATGARLLIARALRDEAYAYENLGSFKEASAATDEALATYTSTGNHGNAAAMLEGRGRILFKQGDLTSAERQYEEALAVYRENGDEHGLASALNNIAIVRGTQGDLEQAKVMMQKSLAAFRKIGDLENEATMSYNLAEILRDVGDLPGSHETLHEAMELYRRLENQSGIAYVLADDARVSLLLGDLVAAENMSEQALRLFEQLGDKHSSPSVLMTLGDISRIKGDPAVAGQRYSEALAAWEKAGEKTSVAESMVALAQLSLDEASAGLAERRLREAIAEFTKQQEASEEVLSQSLLAQALVAQGRVAEAEKEIEDAKPLMAKNQNFETRLDFSIASACVLGAAGRSTDAKDKLEATLSDARKHGFLLYQLEARLALAEIEMKSGQSAAGRTHLQMLQQEAKSKGFLLIARQASLA